MFLKSLNKASFIFMVPFFIISFSNEINAQATKDENDIKIYIDGVLDAQTSSLGIIPNYTREFYYL